MSDRFDDGDSLPAAAVAPWRGDRGARAARLIARLYGSANLALRTRVVDVLLRPLSPLGIAAVAAGAFSVALSRSGGISLAMADVAHFSKAQIAELARFVEQVSPDALQQAAGLVADNGLGVGAFTASVALLLAVELGRAARLRRRAAPDQATGA